MKTIKVGIIGTGFIGQAHIEALRRLPGVEVIALAEVNQTLAEEKANMLGVPIAYGDYHLLINDPKIEVIHNCTPNYLHFEINKAALVSRKHIVSEKPLCLSSVESAELLRLAKNSGVKHAVCYNYTCFPMVQQCRAMVAHGDLGGINLVHGGYYQDWLAFDTDYNWRIDPTLGGKSRAVADIGTHWCATVQYVTGASITEVFADLATIIPERKRPLLNTVTTFSSAVTGGAQFYETIPVVTEDYATVLVRLSNGARGVFTVSQVSHGCKNRLLFTLDGTKASVAWNQEEPNKLWIGKRREPNGLFLRDPELVYPEVQDYTAYPGGHNEGWPDGLKNLLHAFYNDVRGEVHAWYPTFVQGHEEMLIIDAVLESAECGRWVRVGGNR